MEIINKIKKASLIGVPYDLSRQEKKRRSLFNIIVFIGGLVGIPQVVGLSKIDTISALFFSFWTIMCFVGLLVHVKGHYKTSRFLVLISALLCGFVGSGRAGAEITPSVPSITIMVLIFIVYDLKKEWMFLVFFFLVEVIMIIVVEKGWLAVDSRAVSNPETIKIG